MVQVHGKTSTIEYVKEYFENKGYEVFVVNEVPTMLLNSGFNSERCGKVEFLELIVDIELYLAKMLENQANKSISENKIMLFDRCPIDNLAFIDRKELDIMLKKKNTSYDKIINFYDLIIHLETIAKTYPELYNNENNRNRTTNKEIAINRNDRLLEAYNGCNKRVIISGYKNIEFKQEKVIEEIEKYMRRNDIKINGCKKKYK